MHLFLLGVNHKTAPVEVREQFALSATQLPHALRYLREMSRAREAAILSTCNRTEIYALGAPECGPRIEAFLHEFQRVHGKKQVSAPHLLSRHLYHAQDGEAARHLFRVACGLDSLVLGESQILGQVKESLEAGRSCGALAGVLDELFRRAIGCGKRARHETNIGRGALSVGSAAVELARRIFGPLEGHTILILGAGKISALTAQHLVSSGARRILVANRTHERAQELALQFGQSQGLGESGLAQAVTWDEFPKSLHEADIVISSTRAPGFVVSTEQVEQAMKARRQRPLFLIDIAVPRDIEPEAHQLEDVYLYDIDDLQSVVNTNLAQRTNETGRVESIIEEDVAAWQSWFRGLDAQPLMAALAGHAANVRDREVDLALSQLNSLSPREQEIVRSLGRAIAGKLMHAPLRYLREAGANGSSDVEALRRAFGLDEGASSGEAGEA